ncbi:MAG: hypothetical protein EA403_12360 [Spirochaetaceae bacterium]|nr:MAG: hypothetical protein EA403_12360 [Spirochaetaceae bacterium]
MANETVPVRFNKDFALKLAVNILVTLIGLAFLIASYDVARGFQQIVGADQYSRFISILLLVFGLMGVGRSILDFRKGLFENAELKIFVDMRRAGSRIITLFLLLIGNIFLIRRIGYFESGFLFLLFAIFLLGRRTWKRLGTSALAALGITLIVYVVFGLMLNIFLPRGLIIN